MDLEKGDGDKLVGTHLCQTIFEEREQELTPGPAHPRIGDGINKVFP